MSDTIRVRITRETFVSGDRLNVNDVIDLPAADARTLIGMHKAERCNLTDAQIEEQAAAAAQAEADAALAEKRAAEQAAAEAAKAEAAKAAKGGKPAAPAADADKA